MSKASDIAAYWAAMLATIRTANGYQTDIGQAVYRGKRFIEDPRDLDSSAPAPACIVLAEGDDRIVDGKYPGRVLLWQRYVAEAVLPCDPDHPNDAAHAAIADIKRAIWSGDPTAGGLIKLTAYAGRAIMPRESGSALVLAAVTFDCQYAEILAAP